MQLIPDLHYGQSSKHRYFVFINFLKMTFHLRFPTGSIWSDQNFAIGILEVYTDGSKLMDRLSCGMWKSPWSSRQYVGLLDEKPGFESQARHQNEIRKVFLRRFPLSRFLAKTLRVNKIAMKSFSKYLSFGVDFKLQVPPLMYKKINTHNISGVRNQVNNPD